jgi:hypothetical protein
MPIQGPRSGNGVASDPRSDEPSVANRRETRDEDRWPLQLKRGAEPTSETSALELRVRRLVGVDLPGLVNPGQEETCIPGPVEEYGSQRNVADP